jgi:hypothetical protein
MLCQLCLAQFARVLMSDKKIRKLKFYPGMNLV